MVEGSHPGSGIFPGLLQWDVYIIVGLGAGSEGDPLCIQVLLKTVRFWRYTLRILEEPLRYSDRSEIGVDSTGDRWCPCCNDFSYSRYY